MYSAPRNLISLHQGEELLWCKSLESIVVDNELRAHVDLIECAMGLINFFVLEHEAVDEDQKVIQFLGIRLFNGLASSFGLVASGYFQQAAMIQRDMLETIFLLDYFCLHPNKMAEWRNAVEAARKKEFHPAKIRKALDDRDGFKEEKRKLIYRLFCELAAHPTYKGFAMLAPKGMRAHCGPFFDGSAFKALIEEHVRLAIQAGQIFGLHFSNSTYLALEMKLRFIESVTEWSQRFCGLQSDHKTIDEIRALLDTLKA